MTEMIKTWALFYSENQDAEPIQAKLLELEANRQSNLAKYKSYVEKILEKIQIIARRSG
jgi:tetrahydromethanopterin S-methyltransferase subunit F